MRPQLTVSILPSDHPDFPFSMVSKYNLTLMERLVRKGQDDAAAFDCFARVRRTVSAATSRFHAIAGAPAPDRREAISDAPAREAISDARAREAAVEGSRLLAVLGELDAEAHVMMEDMDRFTYFANGRP